MPPRLPPHTIILEEASLELVPKKFWMHESCKLYETRFGIPPEDQILDDNFHHEIIEKLPGREKRGRPDIVHFALLDIMSTPAYQDKQIRPILHTMNNVTILIADGVRLPRTEPRFLGVMSKILRNESGPLEKKFFEVIHDQEVKSLLQVVDHDEICCLTSEGILIDLPNFVSAKAGEGKRKSLAWIVGGFARGHFKEEVKTLANDLIAISDRPLAAHVVTARLSYELERSKSS